MLTIIGIYCRKLSEYCTVRCELRHERQCFRTHGRCKTRPFCTRCVGPPTTVQNSKRLQPARRQAFASRPRTEGTKTVGSKPRNPRTPAPFAQQRRKEWRKTH